MMTAIPVAVALIVTLILLGGPEDALRAMERLVSDLWLIVGTWFRR
jgi:hypothetical protein